MILRELCGLQTFYLKQLDIQNTVISMKMPGLIFPKTSANLGVIMIGARGQLSEMALVALICCILSVMVIHLLVFHSHLYGWP